MSRRCLPASPSRSLLALAAYLLAIAAVAVVGSASAEPSAESISMIREWAKAGDWVSARGRVVDVSESRFFTIEDEANDQIIVEIPDFLTRELGMPERGEKIRVQGKYDRRSLRYSDTATSAEPAEDWGIRAARLDRNLPSSGVNPDPDPAPRKAAEALRREASDASPAAPGGVMTVATPDTPAALKGRMMAARKRALAAKAQLESASAAYARAEYEQTPASQRSALSASQQTAQQAYDQALEEISALVEQARESGVDPEVLELYEAGLTKPPQ